MYSYIYTISLNVWVHTTLHTDCPYKYSILWCMLSGMSHNQWTVLVVILYKENHWICYSVQLSLYLRSSRVSDSPDSVALHQQFDTL